MFPALWTFTALFSPAAWVGLILHSPAWDRLALLGPALWLVCLVLARRRGWLRPTNRRAALFAALAATFTALAGGAVIGGFGAAYIFVLFYPFLLAAFLFMSLEQRERRGKRMVRVLRASFPEYAALLVLAYPVGQVAAAGLFAVLGFLAR